MPRVASSTELTSYLQWSGSFCAAPWRLLPNEREKMEVIRGFLNCLVEFLNNLIRLLRSESPPFFILALIARAASTKGVKKE